jgi:uncharacterized protein YndB with AHSA1/START domain
MSTVHAKVRINRPPSEVFSFVRDLGRLPEWWPWVSAVRLNGPAGEAISGILVTKSGGDERAIGFRVSAVAPPDFLALELHEQGVHTNVEFRFFGGAGSTRLLVAWTFRRQSFSKLLEPFRMLLEQGALMANLRLLKALSEGVGYEQELLRLAA